MKVKVNIMFILMILLPIQRVFAEDWPNWRGPDYNGISKETGWLTTWPEDGPKVLWEKSIGTGFSSITQASAPSTPWCGPRSCSGLTP